MSATDELRELLDERGVEYDETTEYVTTVYLDDKVVRYYGYDGDFSVEVIFPRPYLNNTAWLTPEQAVAATLGIGTMTAEQVRGFLNRHSMFDDTAWLHGTQELVFSEDELQAMADELNAELGSGTCENTQDDTDFMCSVCGKCVDNGRILGFNYCPNCGRRVVK